MKPITLSNEELQAISDGRKTQMRLVVEPQPEPEQLETLCPYGQPGDKLSVFMPRWASPIALKITDVRVEQVQDITGADALAEGPTRRQLFENHDNERMWFKRLWDKENAERGYPWESNPWVWVIKFEVGE